MQSRRLVFRFGAGITAMIGMVGTAQAQASLDRADPLLRVPAGTLRCRSTPDAARSPGVRFRFAEGEELQDDRVIDVLFDSSGAPRHLTVMATTEGGPGHLETRVGAYWFGSNGAVYGYRAADRHTTTKPGSSKVEPPVTALPDSLGSRARALGSWLWEHRCGMRGTSRARTP